MKLWCYGQRRDATDEEVSALRSDFEKNYSTHDCGEWVTEDEKCAICDHQMPAGFTKRKV